LWRPDVDRSARADYITVPETAVVIVSGQFLLGGVLSFEMAVHLTASTNALARRTPSDRAWTLPAYARYDDEVAPASFADLVVRLEDPKHPAVVTY
ncbi:MAG TPA: uridine kinase, partial [Micromonosporaceae bacterium]